MLEQLTTIIVTLAIGMSEVGHCTDLLIYTLILDIHHHLSRSVDVMFTSSPGGRIEHLEPAVLQAVPAALFGFLRPRLAVLTTPNAEFNQLFPGFSGMRHWDHKFEWTRTEFQQWSVRGEGEGRAGGRWWLGFWAASPERHAVKSQCHAFREHVIVFVGVGEH